MTEGIASTKISKIFGPKIDNYEDLTREEKIKVTSCYNNRFPDDFCSRCRFYCICKNK